MDDVFASSEPSLGMLVKEWGENRARAVVVLLLEEVVSFFNASNTMEDTQVAFTTDMIIEEYPYFKVDDMKLALRNGMKGKYGEIYNRLDGSVIMGWLRKYNMERCARADTLSFNEHKHMNDTEGSGMYYNDYRKMLQEMAANGDMEAEKALKRSDDTLDFMKRKSLEKQRKMLEKYEQKEALRNKVQQEGT